MRYIGLQGFGAGSHVQMPELSTLEQSIPFKGFICVAYLALNTSLNMLNRWALGQYGFRFPMILTAGELMLAAVAA